MPKKNIIEVLKWMEANPSFQCFLWIDKETQYQNLTDYYPKAFKTLAEKNGIKFNLSQLIVKDITEAGVIDEYSRYEINKLRPNYGSSSDILRYVILYKFGGAYFDSDNGPGKRSLEKSKIFDTPFNHHCLFVDPKSQGVTGKGVGNDAFFCTAMNPAMKEIEISAKMKYLPPEKHQELFTQEKEKIQTESMGYNAYCYPNINAYQAENFEQDNFEKLSVTDFATISTTGPTTVTEVVDAYETRSKPSPFIKMMDEDLREPKRDLGRKWMNAPITEYKNLDQALDRVLETIAFEARIKQILRLEDHINHLAISVNIHPEAAAQALIEKLKKSSIPFEDLIVVQNSLVFPEVSEFCQFKKIPEKKYFHYPDLSSAKLYFAWAPHKLMSGLVYVNKGSIGGTLDYILQQDKLKKEIGTFLGTTKVKKNFNELPNHEEIEKEVYRGLLFLDRYVNKFSVDLKNLDENKNQERDAFDILYNYHYLLDRNIKKYNDVVFTNENLENIPHPLHQAYNSLLSKFVNTTKQLSGIKKFYEDQEISETSSTTKAMTNK